jgi:hypothetical protein
MGTSLARADIRKLDKGAVSGRQRKNYIVNVPGGSVRTSTTFIQPGLYSLCLTRLYSADWSCPIDGKQIAITPHHAIGKTDSELGILSRQIGMSGEALSDVERPDGRFKITIEGGLVC